MATTAFGTNHALAVKLWSEKLFHEALKECWLGKFIGVDSNSIIQRQTETEKSAGDQITVGLRMQLTGAGVQGDNTLEGNEEALTLYSDAVKIDQLRHAVRSAGQMSEQRIPFEVRQEAKNGLRDWFATRIDLWGFNQLCGYTPQTDTRYTGNQAVVAPDSNHQLWSSISGTITADESLTSTDIFTLGLIDRAVVRAKTLDVATAAGLVPIRPVMIGGEEKYVLFIHPYQHYQLRATSGSQYYDIQKAALQGGQISKNPIYTGAIAEYNGCIIHESIRCMPGVNSSTGAAVAAARRAVLCGAQAALMAFGQGNGPNRMSWVEELFDFKNQLAVSAGFIAGLKKTRFNSLDFGSLVLSSYSAAP